MANNAPEVTEFSAIPGESYKVRDLLVTTGLAPDYETADALIGTVQVFLNDGASTFSVLSNDSVMLQYGTEIKIVLRDGRDLTVKAPV